MLVPTQAEQHRCKDNTKISCYKTCPRMYFIQHVLGWKRGGTGPALVFGLSWHDAQDIVWEQAKNWSQADLADLAFESFKLTWEENGYGLDLSLEEAAALAPRTPSIAHEMLYEYVQARWRILQECEVLAIEQPFAVPIPGMDRQWYVGRLDKTIAYNGQRLIIEHKTTTAYAIIGTFRQDYLDSWFMSSQVKGYQFGGGLYYGDVNAVWVDAALVHKKIHDAFKFINVSHNFTLLSEWLDNTKRWIAEITAEEDLYADVKRLLPGMFRKNEESCFGKYGPCTYIDICRTIPDPSALHEPPVGFIEERWEPFSILKLNKLVEEGNGT